MMDHDIRFRAMGRLDALPAFVRAELESSHPHAPSRIADCS